MNDTKPSRAICGSDEHRAKQRDSALARHERRRARGESGRHSAMVAPTFFPKKRASDDNLRFSSLPGPSRLHEGPGAAELIEWRRRRTREGAG